jgi:hypothetical protein
MENKSQLIRIYSCNIYHEHVTRHPLHINKVQLPQKEDVKYLGLRFDRRLALRKHVQLKRKKLDITLNKTYCLLGRKPKLFINNKLLIYKKKSGLMESNSGARLPIIILKY